MQDNSRFFQFIWRVNALVIFGIAVLAGVLGLYAVYSIFKNETRDREVSDLLAVNPHVPQQDEVRLGYPVAIAGTQNLRIPLYRDQKTDVSYYSKTSGDNMANELFVNSLTGQSKWLFAGTDRIILNQIQTLQQMRAELPVATSILYTIVDRDTNADEKLSTQDFTSIGYTSPDASAFTQLLDNIEKLYAVEQVADDKVMILYFRNGESRMTTYGLPNYSIIVDKVLPKLEAKP
jgi:hypothetical protein